jgi:TRAP-type C4-dicarboxylate transport system permease small subunit
MRKALDGLYAGALAGACLAMATIAALVFIQVLGRMADRVAVWLGIGRFGFAVPSLAEIGGFLFVAAAFMALPYTLRAAGHVRVTLVLRFLNPGVDRWLTAFVLAVAIGLMCFAAWFVGQQTFASFQRGSVSYGLIPIPLWIPQAIMTLGIGIFVVALVDELVATLRGVGAEFRRVEREREETESYR